MSKRGALRASDADRDRVVERLRTAAAEGRIVPDELEQRVTAALSALTYDELDATVADLPSVRPRPPARRLTGHWALAAVRANPMLLVLAIPVLAVTSAMLLAATVMWLVLMVAVLVIGGRGAGGVRHRAPWAYSWGCASRHGRRRPYGDWA